MMLQLVSGNSAPPAPPIVVRGSLATGETVTAGAETVRRSRGDRPGPARTPPREPAAVAHRPLQPPLRVLHAGRGLRLAAEGRPPGLRGARGADARLRRARGAEGAPHGRRAALAP